MATEEIRNPSRTNCIHGQNGGSPPLSQHRPPNDPESQSGGIVSSLFGEPGFTDSGFTGNQGYPSTTRKRIVRGVSKQSELVTPHDKRMPDMSTRPELKRLGSGPAIRRTHWFRPNPDKRPNGQFEVFSGSSNQTIQKMVGCVKSIQIIDEPHDTNDRQVRQLSAAHRQ
jgi:hypothetical protein